MPLIETLRERGRRYFWYGAVPFFWVTTSSIFINDNIIELTDITGSSMSPTLSPDYHTTKRCDWVLWWKWMPAQRLRRGDLVHFGSPVNPEDNAVKRVLALEGDVVVLDPRRRPKRARDGVDVPESRSWDAWEGRARVPKGHVWVEGDNWRKSSDSNWYGPIAKNLITGKAVAVVLPFSKIGGRPWEGVKSRTRVVPGKIREIRDVDEELLETAG